MFDDVLIESAGKDKQKGGWITALISAVIHLGLIGALVAAGYYVKENPEILEKPISAFVVASAPPPPPPPPPAASSATQQRTIPKVEQTTPRETFRQPSEIPKDVPVTDVSTDARPQTGGVVGGVEGGVAGGVVGGEVGGVIGGTLGGKLGGQLGGTGDTPMRVGGDVQAPVAIRRVDPVYTEIARKARVEGFVVIEAIIDRQGNVTDARVLRPLPMGLDNAALNAVRQWKFKPGALNGRPVPVIYVLTVNFKLH